MNALEKYYLKLPEFLNGFDFQSKEVRKELNKRLAKMRSYIQELKNIKIYDYIKENKQINNYTYTEEDEQLHMYKKSVEGELAISWDEAQKIIDAVKSKVQQQNQLNQQNLDNPLIILNNS